VTVPLRPVAVNVLGVVEHPTSGPGPYRVGRDGVPYLPVGDGGIVLGVGLGDGVFARHGDHLAAGICLIHPDPPARAALTGLSCIGDTATVRSGPMAGAVGVVIGKRGEEGRVVVHLDDAVRAGVRPGDQVAVRAEGQGLAPAGFGAVTVHNVSAAALGRLPVETTGTGLRVAVRPGWRSVTSWRCATSTPGGTSVGAGGGLPSGASYTVGVPSRVTGRVSPRCSQDRRDRSTSTSTGRGITA
jgi:hypothetical protein